MAFTLHSVTMIDDGSCRVRRLAVPDGAVTWTVLDRGHQLVGQEVPSIERRVSRFAAANPVAISECLQVGKQIAVMLTSRKSEKMTAADLNGNARGQ